MAVRPAIYLAYAWGYELTIYTANRWPELTVYTAKILCLYTLNRAGPDQLYIR